MCLLRLVSNEMCVILLLLLHLVALRTAFAATATPSSTKTQKGRYKCKTKHVSRMCPYEILDGAQWFDSVLFQLLSLSLAVSFELENEMNDICTEIAQFPCVLVITVLNLS